MIKIIGCLWITKGVALDELGKPQDAIVWYDKALSLDKNDTDAMYNKGVALDELGKPQDAIVWYDKALSLDKNDTDAMYNKGVALDELGKPQDAIVWYDKALSLDKNDTDAMDNKGVALDELGKPQDAIVWFDKALNQTQSNKVVDFDIISNKAYVLGIELKEYDVALDLTGQFLQENPEHKGLLCITSEIYKETGNGGYGSYYGEQLAKLDPNYKCGLIEKSSEIEKPFV